MDQNFFRALVEDRPDFVSLLLRRRAVGLDRFLSPERLVDLYEVVSAYVCKSAVLHGNECDRVVTSCQGEREREREREREGECVCTFQ